jgi:hypothetical protein
MSARLDHSPASGEARRSDSRAGLSLPSKITRSSNGITPSRTRNGGDVRSGLREARRIRADTEQGLHRIRIDAGARAGEATTATATTTQVTGHPIGTDQVADSAVDLEAVLGTGGGETRHLEEVAVLEERHHPPPAGRRRRRRWSRWTGSADLPRG